MKTDDLTPPSQKQLRCRWIRIDDLARFRVNKEDGIEGALEQRTMSFLVLAQLLLHRLPLRDVHHHSRHDARFDHSIYENALGLPRLRQQPKLVADHLALFLQCLDKPVSVSRVFVDIRELDGPEFFGRVIFEHRNEGLIHVEDVPFDVSPEDSDERIVHEVSVVPLGFLQRFLGLLQLGDVTHRTDHTDRIALLIPKQSVLHQCGEDGAVPSGVPDLTAERARLAQFPIRGIHGRHLIRGVKDRQILADQFVGIISVHVREGVVQKYEISLQINNGHPFGALFRRPGNQFQSAWFLRAHCVAMLQRTIPHAQGFQFFDQLCLGFAHVLHFACLLRASVKVLRTFNKRPFSSMGLSR